MDRLELRDFYSIGGMECREFGEDVLCVDGLFSRIHISKDCNGVVFSDRLKKIVRTINTNQELQVLLHELNVDIGAAALEEIFATKEDSTIELIGMT